MSREVGFSGTHERGLRDAPRARRTAAGCFGAAGADIEAAADVWIAGNKHGSAGGPQRGKALRKLLEPDGSSSPGRSRLEDVAGIEAAAGSRWKFPEVGRTPPASEGPQSAARFHWRPPEGTPPGNALTALYGAPGAGNGAF